MFQMTRYLFLDLLCTRFCSAIDLIWRGALFHLRTGDGESPVGGFYEPGWSFTMSTHSGFGVGVLEGRCTPVNPGFVSLGGGEVSTWTPLRRSQTSLAQSYHATVHDRHHLSRIRSLGTTGFRGPSSVSSSHLEGRVGC